MTQPLVTQPPVTGPPVVAPPRSRFRAADITITIILLVISLISLIALVLFAILGLLLDFFGADSPNDTADAFTFALDVFLGCAGVALVGIVLSTIFLVRRRLAWFIALGTLVVISLAGFATLAHWSDVIG